MRANINSQPQFVNNILFYLVVLPSLCRCPRCLLRKTATRFVPTRRCWPSASVTSSPPSSTVLPPVQHWQKPWWRTQQAARHRWSSYFWKWSNPFFNVWSNDLLCFEDSDGLTSFLWSIFTYDVLCFHNSSHAYKDVEKNILTTFICLTRTNQMVMFISLLLHQVSSLISALVVLLVLLFFAPFFYALQKCVLACIIIVSLRGALRKFKDVPAKWRASRNDAIVWLVTMSATALISVELGLLVGVVFSMICVIFKIQNPKVSNRPEAQPCQPCLADIKCLVKD